MTSQATSDGPDLGRMAREALALLMGGDSEAGLALYERCFESDHAQPVPVGLHLLFLERAGRVEAAERLRDLCLRSAGNLVLKGVALEGEREEAAEEYEALIARGHANIRMVEAYLMLLARLGRAERIAEICDERLLLRKVRLEPALADAVQALLLREEATARHYEAAQSVRNQRKLTFAQLDDAAVPALMAELHASAAAYLADWAASPHPLAHIVPGRFELACWALISRGEGYNVPHIHHRGWATGVFYPAGTDGVEPGGDLCVGRPTAAADLPDGWPRATIRPEAGLLVLMPSFYTHWTVPLGRPGLRTAVPFDIVPAG